MKVLTDNQYYHQIADVIREQNGTNNTYKPAQMVSALKDLFYEEVEGVPPISFTGLGEDLLDYRIDGASGGVGDRTENLFNKDTVTVNSFVVQNAATLSYSAASNASDYIPIENATAYTLSWLCEALASPNNRNVGVYDANKNAIETFQVAYYGKSSLKISLDTPNAAYIRFTIDKNMSNVMLNSGSTALPYEPYGYKVPVVVNGKNLLKITTNSFTLKGVTFTVNNDKSITCNGTASSIILIEFSNYFEDLIVNNEYIFSGCPPTGSISTYRLQLVLYSGAVYNVYGGEKKFTYKEEYVGNPNKSIRIVIEKDCVCNNLTFYPMIRLASIEDDTYEPYIEPTTTNIYLDEPIEENESISLSDTGVDIPTIRGTNVLTVDTTVQPSNVYVKARKESQYETAMRERYEEAQAQLDALESEGE